MRISLTTYLILFTSLILVGQQELQFTQFTAAPLLFNTAYAGNDNYTSIVARHREQWTGLDGGPMSQSIMVNFPKIFNRIGIGATVNRSSIGVSEQNEVAGMYAYKLQMRNVVASVGMRISYRQFVNDFSSGKLLAINGFELDPAINRTRYSLNLFNVGVGFYINNDKFYFGADIPRMGRSNIDFESGDIVSTEVRHLTAIAGLYFSLNDKWDYSPHVLLKLAENSPYDLDIQNIFKYQDQISLGLNIRTGGSQKSVVESISSIVGFQYSKAWFISLAYDFTATQLREYESGSFEILLRYNLVKDNSPKIIHSPRHY